MNEQPEQIPIDTSVMTPSQQQHNREREAFIRHIQDQGESIPENFEDAGAYFDSLKNAQAQYTQGQQEIADLKKQYAENGVQNPNYSPNEAPTTEVSEEDKPAKEVDSLKVEAPEEEYEYEYEDTPEAVKQEVSVGEWNDWGAMIDASDGEVPEALRNTIKMRLNVDDKIIDDYMAQRSAVQQQNVSAAADLVGGQEELNNIMSWASQNLGEEERMSVNSQLTGPGYKTAVLGLQARYQASDTVSAARQREPGATPNRLTDSNAYQSVTAYASQQEMFADQRNPRYKTDPKYRQAVEQRIIITQQNG